MGVTGNVDPSPSFPFDGFSFLLVFGACKRLVRGGGEYTGEGGRLPEANMETEDVFMLRSIGGGGGDVATSAIGTGGCTRLADSGLQTCWKAFLLVQVRIWEYVEQDWMDL